MSTSANPAVPARYDRVAQALHWSTAALILAAFALGLTVDDFPKSWKHAVTELHKVIGIAILLLVLLRAAWRLGHPVAPAAELSGGMHRAAAAGHAGLYLLMLAVPAIGLAYSLLRGQGLDLGFAAIPPLMDAAARTVSRPVKEVHELTAYALIALAGLHVLAALWHHLVLRDTVLGRMLPGR
jgi:cytochrome b561